MRKIIINSGEKLFFCAGDNDKIYPNHSRIILNSLILIEIEFCVHS